MNNDTAKAMVGLIYTLPGLAVLLWALYAGLMRAGDREMYAMVEDAPEGESDNPAPPPRSLPPGKARLFFAAVATIFFLVMLSLAATLLTSQGIVPPGATAGKCPFF